MRELAKRYDLTKIRYTPGATRAAIRDESSPFFRFDNQLCISCALHASAMRFNRRSPFRWSGPAFQPARLGHRGDNRFGRDCLFHLRVMRRVRKRVPYGGADGEDRTAGGRAHSRVRTICGYCGVGCAFDAGVREGRVVSMVPCDDGPANHGHACLKGRFGWTYNYAKDRITTPLLRDGTEWKPIEWDRALDLMAQTFQRIKDRAGPDALAAISSSRGTNEENYLFGKFIRCVMGTNHNCARVCHSATSPG